MLILSRKETEIIMIGDDIQVSIERIEGNRVKIGVAAPKHVPILRSEVKPKGEPDGRTEQD